MALFAAALLATLAGGSANAADGTFVAVANRVDMVHDAARNRVYISAGGQILRYATKYDLFRSPIVLGGNLSGIDISPDGKTLVAADRNSSTTHAWVWLVDLDTLVARKMEVAKSQYSGESGTFTAVFGGDGKVYTSSSYSGSGWVPFRRLDPDTGAWNTIVDVCQDTMLSVSGDGKVIAFAESNISDGRWGRYTIANQQLVQRQWYTDGTSWFNYEIGTDRTGSRYLIPTYGGGLVYDENYQKVATIGTYAGQQPSGIVFHPVEPLLYVPFVGTSEVREYDANLIARTKTWTVPSVFPSPYNWAFGSGRMRISRDGSLLMATVPGGLQLIRQYAPLRAEPVFATVAAGASVDIPLAGSIGNGGALSYSLASAPDIGQASIVNGSILRYSAPPHGGGAVAFRYRVSYGQASFDADVGITVGGSNLPPVAVADTAQYFGTQPILIPVLANDSDPDGDSLSITAVIGPTSGSLAIVGDKLQYTPGAATTETFTYSISDGRGGGDSATVTVSKRGRIVDEAGTPRRPLRRAPLAR